MDNKYLIELQAHVLFTHDADGCILKINEPDGDDAPRFFLGRTTAGNLCRFRHDLPDETVAQLTKLFISEPTPSDLRQPPLHLAAYRRVLASHAPIQHEEHGPAYYFPDVIQPLPNVETTRMTRDNVERLRPHFDWMIPVLDTMPPVFAVVQEGGAAAVAVCFSSRIPTVADEAGVNTVEAHRGRGYAAAVVACWAEAIRGLGRIPFYSTAWGNAASQAVARKLGLVMYGDDLSIS
ncbi:MAG: GNAT family N-acetyltransferase [Anaerolineae bacterium]|nr:GNAT family N-acetyltransferase [Anaerolineae bacterium]